MSAYAIKSSDWSDNDYHRKAGELASKHFGGDIVDVLGAMGTVVGLMTVYLVMAMTVTAANEGIAAMLSSRGAWLKKGVLALLAPASAPPDAKARLQFWIARLLRPIRASVESNSKMRSSGASIRDAGSPMTDLEVATKLRDATYESPFIAHLASGPLGLGFVPSYIPAWTMLQGVLHAAEDEKDAIFDKVEAIREAAAKLPVHSPMRKAIDSCIATCNGSIDEFRKQFETWFSEFEAQITSWYRQKTQGVIALLSALLVICSNVDTFSIVRQLSADPKLRDAVTKIGLADGTAGLLNSDERDKARQAHDKAYEALRKGVLKKDPVTSPEEILRLQQQTEAALRTYLAKQSEYDELLGAKRQAIESTGLRLGWAPNEWQSTFATGGSLLLLKLLGLLVSVMAVSLGAPFWFNILRNLASVRSVGMNIAEQAKSKAG